MTLLDDEQASVGIEVTPEMWNAGVSAYIEWSAGAYPYKEGYDRDLPAMIYRAMELARQSSVG